MWGGGEGGGAAQPPARPSAAGISAGRLCLTPGLSLGSALEAGRPGEKGPDSDPGVSSPRVRASGGHPCNKDPSTDGIHPTQQLAGRPASTLCT